MFEQFTEVSIQKKYLKEIFDMFVNPGPYGIDEILSADVGETKVVLEIKYLSGKIEEVEYHLSGDEPLTTDKWI